MGNLKKKLKNCMTTPTLPFKQQQDMAQSQSYVTIVNLHTVRHQAIHPNYLRAFMYLFGSVWGCPYAPKHYKKTIFWLFWTISITRMGLLIWLGPHFQAKTLGQHPIRFLTFVYLYGIPRYRIEINTRKNGIYLKRQRL